MKNSEKIKQLIAEELTFFLISDTYVPESIEIRIESKTATSRLIIDAEKISEVLNKIND